jgi:hypothetical protein
MEMAVFWDVAPCSLVEVYRHFRGAYYLHHQGEEYQDGKYSYCEFFRLVPFLQLAIQVLKEARV